MEKTIFDYINSLLYTKKKIDINIEDKSFILYLFNRWVSMYSPELCYYVNETLNKRLYEIFPNINEQYNYAYNILPKMHYKKINYIKKLKSNNDKSKLEKEHNTVKSYADNLELSQREIELYLDMSK